MGKPGHRWSWVCGSVVFWWSITGLVQAAVPIFPRLFRTQEVSKTEAEDAPLDQAFSAALEAANLAQTARTAEDWSQVVASWANAIQALQDISPTSPQWVFAQRKTREYLANQEIAQRRTEEAGIPAVFPTLGSTILDEQLGLYLSYLTVFGPPDVMVLGSSRALQGLNPQILQQRLSRQGLEVQVYTFAVNGATAQVVSFILEQLLTPEHMPRMIIWAGGSRSFNSARVDRTFSAIVDSPGYAALEAGDRPAMDWNDPADVEQTAKARRMPVTAINGYGFLPVTDVFDPAIYYQTFPRVQGLYDAAYQPFELQGVQTTALREIAELSRTAEIPLVFVSLPLSSDYLDNTRLIYERQFQQYLQQEAALGGFTVVDLLQHWPTQNQFFADPSHLNERGAAQIARLLARNPDIPWQQLSASTTLSASDELEE